MPKIAIAGKGGVGKTTLAALLAHVYAEQSRTVLAIDADPAASLAFALGFPPDLAAQITPIAEMDDLIFERTGARPGTVGGYFSLNPRVDDIPDRFAAEHRGIKLLQLGTIKQGGTGCICPESALLRSLVTHLLLARDEVVIMDMEAGTEHLGRGTASAVDAFLIVVEPSRRSLATAAQIHQLAQDIRIPNCYLVGNRVRDGARTEPGGIPSSVPSLSKDRSDREFIAANSGGVLVAGYLSEDPRVSRADREGVAVFDAAPELVEQAREIAALIS